MPDWKWYPQFTGLIKDPEGKHHKKMGMAIWLYNFFCADADRKTGEWTGHLTGISERTGIPLWTIKRYMQVLKKEDYISANRSRNSLVVKIKKYKTLVMQDKNMPDIDEISRDERTPLEKNPKSRLHVAELKELQDYFKGVLKTFHLKHLDGYAILQMYWDKIPLVIIKSTVDELMSRGKDKEIFSVRYFKRAIYENHKKYTHKFEPEKELMGKEASDRKEKFHDLAKNAAKEKKYGAEKTEEIV